MTGHDALKEHLSALSERVWEYAEELARAAARAAGLDFTGTQVQVLTAGIICSAPDNRPLDPPAAMVLMTKAMMGPAADSGPCTADQREALDRFLADVGN